MEHPELIEALAAAPGYLLVSARYGEVNQDGTRKVEFTYQRERFSYEDSLRALSAFKKHLEEDVENG